jgi:hypothetical protein
MPTATFCRLAQVRAIEGNRRNRPSLATPFRVERFDIFTHQARDRRSIFGPGGLRDADLTDLHHLVVDCLAVRYRLRTTGSIKVGSLFFTFPTRVLTGQQVISSAG